MHLVLVKPVDAARPNIARGLLRRASETRDTPRGARIGTATRLSAKHALVVVFLLAGLGCSSSPCDPACGDAFTCVDGECVSVCRPGCATDEICTPEATCVPTGTIDAGAIDGAVDADTPLLDAGRLDAALDARTDLPCVADADGDGIPDDAEGVDPLRDSDGDGTPDRLDLDSDGDTILDAVEWTSGCDPSAPLNDTDADGVADYLDDDSDADGVADACEARASAVPEASELSLPVLDTDGDGRDDYRDRDSDGDRLRDGLEDVDADCVLDPSETDRRSADTDRDLHGDLAETILLGAAAARDPSRDPARSGRMYVIAPYSPDGSAMPTPASTTIALAAQPARADLALIVDTTTGMGAAISALRASFASTIVPALRSRVPDLAFAVGAFADVPDGASSDRPFTVVRVSSTSTAAAATAIDALTASGGGDVPDSAVLAMHSAITGSAITWPTGSVGPFAAPSGTYGALQLREGSVPIAVLLTSAPMHNGKRALGPSSYDTTFQHPYAFAAADADRLVDALRSRGAIFVALTPDDGARSTAASAPYGYLAYLADLAGGLVPPSAFSSSTCRTGLSGNDVAPDGPGGTCRLVISLSSAGGGLGAALVDGVSAALGSMGGDLHARAIDGLPPAVDDLLASIGPVPTGGSDPITAASCLTFAPSALADVRSGPRAVEGPGDIAETVRSTRLSGAYCFRIAFAANRTIPERASATLRSFTVEARATLGDTNTVSTGVARSVDVIIPPDPDL